MWTGLLALIIAAAAAGWLLFRLAGNGEGNADQRSMIILKSVVLLAVTAALFAAKLGPLAFMVLVGVGGVMAIESWRASHKELDEQEAKPSAPFKRMSEDEALSVLGLPPGADAKSIRSAHRKLISQLHPDKGGTDYLAAKINDARDHLLARLGED